MPKHERFWWDPDIVDGGAVRWGNDVIVECDKHPGRKIAAALNAVLLGESRKTAAGADPVFDVLADFGKGGIDVSIDFWVGNLLSIITLSEADAEKLVRMIKVELAMARRARTLDTKKRSKR